MKVVVTGGTGFIGRALLPALIEGRHQVVVLTRQAGTGGAMLPVGVQTTVWDARSSGAWESDIDGADAVLNLAGESIGGKRWSRDQKERIIGSRVDATRAIVNAVRIAKKKPAVFINGSAIGFYGDVPEGSVTEQSAAGTGFLAETVGRWEREAFKAAPLGVRVITLRTGVVLGDDGGALAKMLLPFRLFFGGPIGSGTQWFSWIHRDDVVGAALFAMTYKDLSGPVNVTAPEPVTMKEFCSVLGRALHRPSWAPVPAVMMKLLLGEMSEIVLTGQKVIPSRLLENSYRFRFPHLQEALEDVVR
ncbi:MAG TPA: TIGR01777 family oxidoreductase [Bacteroidota bacterium]|nr:TIGR01777 family oxidoreductase [Bacteroidota bacterium]